MDRSAWVFTEPPLTTVSRDPARFVLGGSELAWHGNELRARFDERTAPLGRVVRGSITLRPTHRFEHSLALDPHGRHHWWAIAPTARVEVDLQQPLLRFSGSGYHDANFGAEPLERAFCRWTWSRTVHRDGTVVLYDVTGRVGSMPPRGFVFGSDGSRTEFDPPRLHPLPPSRWGMRRATRVQPGAAVAVVRTLEDSPFYTRTLLQTSGVRRELSIHESLDLDRFCHPLVQLMLPFRIRRGWRA